MVRDTVPPAFIVVSPSEIADRAYAIYLGRGCRDGFDRQDWFQAERELKSPSGTSAAVSRRTSKTARTDV
jgi:hypothetical protein